VIGTTGIKNGFEKGFLHKGTWKVGTVMRDIKILKYYVKLYLRVWVKRFLIKGKINLL